MRAIWSSEADKRAILRLGRGRAGYLPPSRQRNGVTQVHSARTSGRSRTGGDRVGEDREGGDEGGETTREQKEEVDKGRSEGSAEETGCGS